MIPPQNLLPTRNQTNDYHSHDSSPISPNLSYAYIDGAVFAISATVATGVMIHRGARTVALFNAKTSRDAMTVTCVIRDYT